jgi:hypothetical protein
MVVHHGVGADVNRKALGEREQAFFYPVTPMFERPTAVEVLATEKGATNTARNAVIVGGVIETDEGFSRSWHCSFLDARRSPSVLYFDRDALFVNGWVSDFGSSDFGSDFGFILDSILIGCPILDFRFWIYFGFPILDLPDGKWPDSGAASILP